MKQILKKSKIIFSFIKLIKCLNTNINYHFWNISSDIILLFKNKDEKQKNKIKNIFSNEWSKKFNDHKKIIYLGTVESESYTGLIDELRGQFNVSIFKKINGEFGIYTEADIIGEKNGKTLNTEILERMIYAEINNGIDNIVVLSQALGMSFDVGRIYKLKKSNPGIKFINLCWDDRLVFWLANGRGAIGLKKILDLALVANKEVVRWYRARDVAAIYFPMAASQDFYKPLGLKKKYQIGFVGKKYGFREDLINLLIDSGFNVCARGPGWPDGAISYKDNNKFYNQCEIIFGVGAIGHCTNLFTQKMRDFEAVFTGVSYLTSYTPELSAIYGNLSNVYLYKNKRNILEHVKNILSNGEKKNLNLSDFIEKNSWNTRINTLASILNCSQS